MQRFSLRAESRGWGSEQTKSRAIKGKTGSGGHCGSIGQASGERETCKRAL